MIANTIVPIPGSDGLIIGYGGDTVVNISAYATDTGQIDFYDSLGSGPNFHVCSLPAGFIGIVQVNRKLNQGLYVVNVGNWSGAVGIG